MTQPFHITTVPLCLGVGLMFALPSLGAAATITGWNTDNIAVAPTPPEGETGFSVVYDRAATDPAAISSGAISFAPPEAISPGITVTPETYTQGGPDGATLDGCIMTSNPAATCTSEFQSGKRLKEVVTGTGPIDLVFDVASSPDTSVYQVFSKLINATGTALTGFSIELGFGTGDDFVAATGSEGLSFSTDFAAKPSGSGSSSSQNPFGLFGDASTNQNFVIDGFFASERTGFDIDQGLTTLSSADVYGPYADMFGDWMTRADVPEGLFWDFDSDETTDGMLMAWEYEPGLWELRRDDIAVCDVLDPGFCAPGSNLDTYVSGLDLDALYLALGINPDLLAIGEIEDLANLNVNYAIEVGDLFGASNFTLRTTVMPAPVPLPAGAPLLIGGLAALAMARRRKARA